MADWIVTLPKGIEWEDYRRELKAVEDGSSVLNYRVPASRAEPGDRCFITWRGRVRGWMRIVGVERWKDGFTCTTTGKEWPPGVYLQRSGHFHTIAGPEVKGFQGIRRYTA